MAVRFGLILLALLVVPASAWAQQPNAQGQPGIAVDARGGQAVDPTKNVLDLVQAAIQRQDDLRHAEAKFQNALRKAEDKFQNSMREADIRRVSELRDAESRLQTAQRDAETRRVNELAVQKQLFDLELARVLRANVDSAALLLSTQLKEVKTDLSDRTAKLEQFRWETGGKSAGYGDLVAWLFAGLMALVALGGLIVNIRRQPAAVVVRPSNGPRKGSP